MQESPEPEKSPWDDFTPYQGEPVRDFPLWLHRSFVGLFYAIVIAVSGSIGAWMLHFVFHLKTRRYGGEFLFARFHNDTNQNLCWGLGAAIGIYVTLRWLATKPFPRATKNGELENHQNAFLKRMTQGIDFLLAIFLGGIGGLFLFYIRLGKRGNSWYPFENFHNTTTDTISVVLGALAGLWIYFHQRNQKKWDV